MPPVARPTPDADAAKPPVPVTTSSPDASTHTMPADKACEVLKALACPEGNNLHGMTCYARRTVAANAKQDGCVIAAKSVDDLKACGLACQ